MTLTTNLWNWNVSEVKYSEGVKDEDHHADNDNDANDFFYHGING